MPTGDPSPPDPLDRDAVDRLIVEHLPQLRAFVRLNADADLRARESCSDLVQTVCRQLLEHGEGARFDDAGRLRSWLFTAVLNKIRDRHRYWAADRRRATPAAGLGEAALLACYDSIATPSAHAIAAERAAALEQAFDALPAQYREIITLSRLAGWSHAELAAHLDKTEANVRVLLSRALARLTSLLEQTGVG